MIFHPETWIIHGTLYTQDEKRRVREAHLQIIDGTIVAISPTLPKRIKKNTTIIDAQGLIILPGMVQSHVHLCQTLFRNQADDMELLDWLTKKIWKMEAAHTDQTLHISALLGIYELLSSGTTCILDMGTIRHTESILRAVQESGIRANVGKCLMDHPGQTPSYLREKTQFAIKEACQLFDQWNGKENDRIRVSFAPRFAISCTERLLREVGQISQMKNALIHTHASENLKEIALVRELYGAENLEVLHQFKMTSPRLVIAHGIWTNDQEKQIIEKTQSNVVHCPSSNLKLASGIAPVPEYLKRGINVALGADGAPCNNNLNIFQEIRMAALIHKPQHGPKSMNAMQVLDLATRNGAKALNWFESIGSIEVGKKADLIAINLNTPFNHLPESKRQDPEAIASSIVYSSNPLHLRWSMIDGKTVFTNGRVASISAQHLINQVRIAQKIIERRMDRIGSE